MTDDRPNILVITTDQQRGDCLGIEGHPVLQTPYLDWIAASGVRFSRAYSACPVCVPSRRTMLTGRKPSNHGLLQNGQGPMPWPTMPGVFQEAGYQTHLVGKAHWGPPAEELGFEKVCWADSPSARTDNDYQRYLRENGIDFPAASDGHGMPGNGFPVRSWHLDEQFHFSNWCANNAIRYMQERDTDRPFFMMVNFIHPHQPLTPPQFYYDRYLNMDLPEPFVADWARVFDGPVRGLQPECWRLSLDEPVMHQMRAAYYGCINHIDNQVGRFVTGRVGAGAPSNTIILFASDHGEMLGDHQWLRKRNPYEPSARVPFMIQFPNSMDLPQEQVIDRPIELMDMMPTLLDAAGVDIPDTVDGDSLLPLIRNPEGEWRDYVHGECASVPSSDGGMQYLTDGKKKYVWLPGQGVEQLFDLIADPNEMVNLAADSSHADEVATWRGRLIEELAGRPEGFTDGEKLVEQNGPTTGKLEVW